MRRFRPIGESAVRSLKKCFLSAPGVKWLPAFISLFLIASGTFAQTFPPASSCTSKELDWLEGLLQSGASINSLTPGNRRMNLTVKNATTSDRRSFAVWGTLNRYDSYGTLKGTQRVFFCVDSVKKNSTLTLASKDSIYYGQDEILEMTNIYTAWSSSSGKENCDFLYANTANISPRCAVKTKMNVYTGVNARLHPNRAACGNGKGLLKAIPFGGKGPYTISVTQDGSSAQVTQIVNDRDSFNFELPPGIYKITVIDGKYNSNVFTREIQAPLPIDKPTFNAGHPSCTVPKGWVNVVNKDIGFAFHLKQNGNTITTTTDGNFPDVASGDYQLVAVKGSCNSADSVKINKRPNIPGKPQFVITHPNCDKSKGFINISNVEENVIYNLTQNGTQKFTASNGIFSEIDPGAYDLIAQGASCKNQDTLSVNPQPVRPNKPQFNVTHPNCIRARGLIELTNNDNNNSYQLKQNGEVKYTASSGNIDEVETGDYEIIATRGACSNADSVKVNKRPFVPGKPNFSITHPSCTRGKGYVTLTSTESDVTYTMKVNDQVAYTADEYGVFSEVDPGSYTIHANASICSNSDNATVNPQPPTPVAPTLSVTAPSFCNATGSVVITAPTGNNLEYSSDGGTTWSSSNEFSDLAAGTGSSMSFKVRNAHQCISPASTICSSPEAPAVANTIVGAQQTSGKYLGSAELTETSVTVKTIPNPFNTKVRFVIASPEAGNGVLELYNIQGQKVKTIFQGRISAGTNFFDLSMPNSRRGEYIYVLRMGEKQLSGKLLQLENSKY